MIIFFPHLKIIHISEINKHMLYINPYTYNHDYSVFNFFFFNISNHYFGKKNVFKYQDLQVFFFSQI